MPRPVRESPWRALFKLAAQQEGLFSARQAKESGCSLQLLERYVEGGRVEKVEHALYRIVDFPAGEHEGLLAVWLWTRSEGVFSHETALFLHNLSDALPIRAHITVPAAWKTRRIKIPEQVALYHGDLPASDRTWVGPLPVTGVRRTLADCLHGTVASELVAQASADAARRGLITPAEVWSAPSIDLLRQGARR
ncbi:MAG TPA: type IV toxin-antitoxin system AbiEi family antitoxin domain-containing protein [Kofleriaceae bacterium]|nr:type IV toxin-antitoxin system AbiEi family antitoxin domain-containing protein [Kofleriaceae bacterium]